MLGQVESPLKSLGGRRLYPWPGGCAPLSQLQLKQGTMTKSAELDFDRLHEAIPEMTESLVGYMYDAAVFCFHRHRHNSGIRCEVRSLDETLDIVSLIWTRQFTKKIANTFGDTGYAVEFAAEGIACLTIRAYTEYTVIERSQRGDGVDFWLAKRHADDNYSLQRSARMECKGIFSARYPSDIMARIDEAIEQSARSDSTDARAYIIAAEFGQPVIYMVQR